MSQRWKSLAVDHINGSIAVKRAVIDQCLDGLIEAAATVSDAMLSGNKVLICGNGGSAADSQHLAAEFVSTLSMDYERPAMAAIALTTDTSMLTAFANDYGFDRVFARQVEALGRAGDVLIGFSTSGNARDVVHAVDAARKIGLKTIGLLGRGGGDVGGMVDHAIIVPSATTQFIQESHLALYHILVAIVERTVHPKE